MQVPHGNQAQAPDKVRIMQDIDRKLPQLPVAQQNLVAAYARGLNDGLALEARRATRAANGRPKRGHR